MRDPIEGEEAEKGNQLTLKGNVSVDGGGSVDLQNVGTVVLAGNVTIDTDKAGAGASAGGDILFGSASRIDGDGVLGRTLTLDARATDTGGAANTAGAGARWRAPCCRKLRHKPSRRCPAPSSQRGRRA